MLTHIMHIPLTLKANQKVLDNNSLALDRHSIQLVGVGVTINRSVRFPVDRSQLYLCLSQAWEAQEIETE